MTFLLVWASLEACKLILQKRQIAGSSLLALVINFKLIPIAILLYLFYKKQFKAFGFTILFFTLYLFLPALVLGYEFNMKLLQSWLSSLTLTESNSIYEDLGRPSLSSLIPSLIMETPVDFSLKRNFLTLDSTSTIVVLNTVRMLLLVILAVLFGKPFREIFSKKTLFYDVALIFIATPLIFPHQGKYSFFYLMPAYAFCIYSLIRFNFIRQRPKYKRINLIVLFFVSFSFFGVTLTTDGLVGRRLSDFSEYIHTITYGAFFLLTAMAFLKPRRLTKPQN